MKIALWCGIGLLAVLVISFVVLTSKIDGIAQGIVETGATNAFGLTSTTDSVNVSIFSGAVGVRRFQVDNLPGYEAEHFLDLGGFDVQVQLGSLFEDELIVPLIQMTDLAIRIEQKGRKTNVQELLDNIRKRSESKPAPESGESGKSGRKLRVSELRLHDIQAHVQLLPVGGNISRVTIPIKSLVLHDVTPENARAQATEEILRQILPAILAAVLQKGQDVLPADLIRDLSDDLGKTVAVLGDEAQRHLKNAAGELAQGILKDLPGELGKKVEDAVGDKLDKGVKDLGDKVGGLLGGKKEDEEE